MHLSLAEKSAARGAMLGAERAHRVLSPAGEAATTRGAMLGAERLSPAGRAGMIRASRMAAAQRRVCFIFFFMTLAPRVDAAIYAP